MFTVFGRIFKRAGGLFGFERFSCARTAQEQWHTSVRFARRAVAHLFVFFLFGTGCATEYKVEVDLSTDTPRFLMHEPTWGWPFRWPRVSALAIGADEESMWEIEAADSKGLEANQLAIIYGDVPAGFVQTHPPNDARPRKLTQGRTYFVGATGPEGEIFRAIFALPVGPEGTPPDPEFAPDRKRLEPEVAPSPPPKPAD